MTIPKGSPSPAGRGKGNARVRRRRVGAGDPAIWQKLTQQERASVLGYARGLADEREDHSEMAQPKKGAST